MVLVLLSVVAGCGRVSSPTAIVTSPSPAGSPTPALASSPHPAIGGSPSPTATATPKSTNAMPQPRSNAAWVFNPASGTFLLFGGRTTTGQYHEFPQALGDTWTWDGKSWTQLTTTSTAPIARWDPVAAPDPAHGGVLICCGSAGGDTWTSDGSRWTLMGPDQSPPQNAVKSMTGDAAVGGVLLYAWTDPVMAYAQTAVNGLWAWDGKNWTSLQVSGASPNHSEAPGAVAYDPTTHLVVLFEHLQGAPTTWTFDGTAWTRTATTTGTASQSFTMAQDDATSTVVLYGANGDTWTWTGTKWTPQSPVHSPGPRVGASMTYDSVHHEVVLFGGYSGTAASLREHNDIWSWNGTDWTLVAGS